VESFDIEKGEREKALEYLSAHEIVLIQVVQYYRNKYQDGLKQGIASYIHASFLPAPAPG